MPGQHDALLAILLDAANAAPGMPGCRLYLVSLVPEDADAIAVTEVWDDQASHDASLSLPDVRATVSRARPLIAGSGGSTVFHPVAGWAQGTRSAMLWRSDDADSERG